jgi:membrane-associated phospholipid phosphatase
MHALRKVEVPMPRTILVLVLMVAFSAWRPATIAAQAPDARQDGSSPGAAIDVPDPNQPAAVGEEGAKPRRHFLSALVHNLGDDVKHIPRRNSLYWVAGGTALALAIHPEDGKINRRFVGNSTVDTLFTPGKYIGNTGVFAAGALGTYIVGNAMDMPRIQHLGMDETEAMLLSEGISETAKLVFRRDRPTDATGHQSKGYSLPSGHATLTFAAATVLQQHLGYKAGIPTYLVASYVAMSRLHDNRHYASDVVAGAATGIIIGRSVTYHGRNFWTGPVVVPGGVEFVIAKR